MFLARCASPRVQKVLWFASSAWWRLEQSHHSASSKGRYIRVRFFFFRKRFICIKYDLSLNNNTVRQMEGSYMHQSPRISRFVCMLWFDALFWNEFFFFFFFLIITTWSNALLFLLFILVSCSYRVCCKSTKVGYDGRGTRTSKTRCRSGS